MENEQFDEACAAFQRRLIAWLEEDAKAFPLGDEDERFAANMSALIRVAARTMVLSCRSPEHFLTGLGRGVAAFSEVAIGEWNELCALRDGRPN